MRERFVRCAEPCRGAAPQVRFLFEEMKRQRMGVLDMSERSGVNKNTLKDWRRRSRPTVQNLEACLNVLGYTLRPTRMRDEINCTLLDSK